MNQSFEMNIGESGHFDAKKRLSVRLNVAVPVHRRFSFVDDIVLDSLLV